MEHINNNLNFFCYFVFNAYIRIFKIKNFFIDYKVFLLILSLGKVLGMEMHEKPAEKPKRKAFNAAAFLAEAPVGVPPVAVARPGEGEGQKPGRRAFNAAAFLAEVPVGAPPVAMDRNEPPVVVGYKAPRKAFNAAAFLAVPVVADAARREVRKAFNAVAFLEDLNVGRGGLMREEIRRQEGEENYRQIVEESINKVKRENAAYGALLEELRNLGILCLNNQVYDQKEPADWLKTLILTFADLSADHRAILYAEIGNYIGEVCNEGVGMGAVNVPLFSKEGRMQDDQKLLVALNLYGYLGEQITYGRIVVPKVLPPPPAAVVVQSGGKAIPRGPWIFWEDRGVGKHFAMPAGLRAAEEEYVSFFMEKVMPKLALLHAAGKITDNLVDFVIRAASMGLIGLTEERVYLDAFESKLRDTFDAAGRDGDLVRPWSMLIAPDSVSPLIQAKRRFPAINNNNCFFRDLGPTFNLISTFFTLHTEDEAVALVEKYNALPRHERFGKADELKRQAISTVRDKLLGLPNLIRDTFGFLLEKNCGDDVWVRFIKGFNTNLCYDGTYDSIVPVGAEIVASGDGIDKRPPNKIFAKMLSDVPQKLQAVLTDENIEKFVNAVKKASGDDTANPSADFFARSTLERWFGVSGAKILRDFIGNGPDGGCKLTDAVMLELIYWAPVMSMEGVMPPGGLHGPIAKLLVGDD